MIWACLLTLRGFGMKVRPFSRSSICLLSNKYELRFSIGPGGQVLGASQFKYVIQCLIMWSAVSVVQCTLSDPVKKCAGESFGITLMV